MKKITLKAGERIIKGDIIRLENQKAYKYTFKNWRGVLYFYGKAINFAIALNDAMENENVKLWIT